MFKAQQVMVQTFCTAQLLGTRQYLNVYTDQESWEVGYASQVQKDGDHGFVFCLSSVQARVRWKNLDGEIQLCGSGAYAIAWYLNVCLGAPLEQLHSLHYPLQVYWEGEQLCLSLPNATFHEVSQWPGCTLYYDPNSGIYYLHLLTAEGLCADDLALWAFLRKFPPESVHGFCVFVWNAQQGFGELRYFTPMHGRNEDDVTGSVHRVLSPLIFQLYGVSQQHWYQRSRRGGYVLSYQREGATVLTGTCRLFSQQGVSQRQR
ncbi:MAG: hypothetical protein OXT67_08455 [Zetaproteobacteria bacterium]|nr:hypothetical protein [Zetaproteobacteria bacterium]